MGRRGKTVLAIVAVVAAGVGLWLGYGVQGRSRPSPRFATAPTAYVILYKNTVNGIPQWEILSARRPFDGSDLTYRTSARPGPGATADAGTISTRTGLFTENSSGVHLVSDRQPGPPSADLWLSSEMSDAIVRGLAVDQGRTRRIAGFQCDVYRLADPPSGPLHALNESVGHDDMCMSDSGLVLSEAWTYHGSVVLQRTAVSVAIGPGWPATLPRPGSTADAGPAGTAGGVSRADSHPDTFIASPPAPAGFRSAGEPVAFRLPDPEHPTASVASTVVWAFADGSRLITVEAGRQRGGQLPWNPGDTVTRPVRLTGLGAATTALRSDGAEVRIDLGSGRFVRVRGTVSPQALTAYAAQLRRD